MPNLVERTLVRLGHRWPHHRVVASPCFRYGRRLASADAILDRWAELPSGDMIHLSLQEAVFRHLYFFGEYEPDVVRTLSRLARPGERWLDIGANIGVLTLCLSRAVGDRGQVLAFEPNPAMLRHLRQTVDRAVTGGNIVLHECALGAEPGIAQLHLPAELDRVVGGSGRGSLIGQPDIADEVTVKVPVRTLDDVLSERPGPIDGIKIDVEGFESAVLDGARRTLNERPPRVILSEVTHLPGAVLGPQELIRKFETFGYATYRMPSFERYADGEPLDGNRDANMLFVRIDAEAEIRSRMSSRQSPLD